MILQMLLLMSLINRKLDGIEEAIIYWTMTPAKINVLAPTENKFKKRNLKIYYSYLRQCTCEVKWRTTGRHSKLRDQKLCACTRRLYVLLVYARMLCIFLQNFGTLTFAFVLSCNSLCITFLGIILLTVGVNTVLLCPSVASFCNQLRYEIRSTLQPL